MRITISITKEDLQLIDDYCNSTGIKRSTFLTRTALKEVGVYKIGRRYKEAKRLGKILDKRDKKVETYFNPVPKPKK